MFILKFKYYVPFLAQKSKLSHKIIQRLKSHRSALLQHSPYSTDFCISYFPDFVTNYADKLFNEESVYYSSQFQRDRVHLVKERMATGRKASQHEQEVD